MEQSMITLAHRKATGRCVGDTHVVHVMRAAAVFAACGFGVALLAGCGSEYEAMRYAGQVRVEGFSRIWAHGVGTEDDLTEEAVYLGPVVPDVRSIVSGPGLRWQLGDGVPSGGGGASPTLLDLAYGRVAGSTCTVDVKRATEQPYGWWGLNDAQFKDVQNGRLEVLDIDTYCGGK